MDMQSHLHARTPWRLVRRVSVALLLAACGAFIQGCRQPAPEPESRPRPVKTMVVEPASSTASRTFAGRVVAAREADMAFRVGGLLAALPVREGQRVKAGEVIASLRANEFQARVASLEGQLSQAESVLRALQAGQRVEERLRLEAQVRAAEARLVNARAEYVRFKELVEQNAVARSEFELREAQFRIAEEEVESARQLLEAGATARPEDIDAAEANVRNLRARVDEAKIQLDDATLRAPFDGVIAKRLVEENQSVSVGQPIVRFQDADEVSVAMDVPENAMAVVKRAGDIKALVAEFSAVPGRTFPVEVREVAQVADPTTRTFRVRTVMPAPEDVTLLPGMTATVRATAGLAEGGGRIRVPISAIYRESGKDAVAWVLGSDQMVRRRTIALGGVAGGEIEVLEGLKAGDRIVIAGVSQLREGMPVRDLGDALGGRP